MASSSPFSSRRRQHASVSYAGCSFLNVSAAVCTGIFGMLVVVLDQSLATALQMFTSGLAPWVTTMSTTGSNLRI